MSPITEEYWRMLVGDVPMPEDATRDMAWAAVDAIEQLETRDKYIKMMQDFEESKKKYLAKKEFYEKRQAERGEDYREKLELYAKILKQIDDGIELIREQIYG